MESALFGCNRTPNSCVYKSNRTLTICCNARLEYGLCLKEMKCWKTWQQFLLSVLCWFRLKLWHCDVLAGVWFGPQGSAQGAQQLLLTGIPDITAGGISHQSHYSSRQKLLLTSNRQLFHQDSSPSQACPGHYSTCWFWPLPCIWHKCSLLSHQSCTASLVLLLASSRRSHQRSLSRKLK